MELVKKAATINRPTEVAVHGMDYIDYQNKGVSEFGKLTDRVKEFVEWVERELDVKVKFIGTGPTNEELIDKRVESHPETLKPLVLEPY